VLKQVYCVERVCNFERKYLLKTTKHAKRSNYSAQGKNAYTYWEVRENVEMVVDAIVDMIKSEIEKELSDLKASVISLTKTTFTVYDPANGEIQAEIHLPIPLRSLEEVPVIDTTPYITKMKQYRSRLPGLPQISTDVSTWLPPHDGG